MNKKSVIKIDIENKKINKFVIKGWFDICWNSLFLYILFKDISMDYNDFEFKWIKWDF